MRGSWNLAELELDTRQEGVSWGVVVVVFGRLSRSAVLSVILIRGLLRLRWRSIHRARQDCVQCPLTGVCVGIYSSNDIGVFHIDIESLCGERLNREKEQMSFCKLQHPHTLSSYIQKSDSHRQTLLAKWWLLHQRPKSTESNEAGEVGQLAHSRRGGRFERDLIGPRLAPLDCSSSILLRICTTFTTDGHPPTSKKSAA